MNLTLSIGKFSESLRCKHAVQYSILKLLIIGLCDYGYALEYKRVSVALTRNSFCVKEREGKIMKKKCGGLFKEFVKAIARKYDCFYYL